MLSTRRSVLCSPFQLDNVTPAHGNHSEHVGWGQCCCALWISRTLASKRERERESKRKRESKHDTDSNLKLGLCRVANWGQDREPLLYPELLTILLQSRGHRTEPVITTLRHHLLDDMSSWQFVCLFMNHAIPGEIHLHEGKTQRRSNTHRLLLLFSVALYCIHYIRPHHLHYR